MNGQGNGSKRYMTSHKQTASTKPGKIALRNAGRHLFDSPVISRKRFGTYYMATPNAGGWPSSVCSIWPASICASPTKNDNPGGISTGVSFYYGNP